MRVRSRAVTSPTFYLRCSDSIEEGLSLQSRKIENGLRKRMCNLLVYFLVPCCPLTSPLIASSSSVYAKLSVIWNGNVSTLACRDWTCLLVTLQRQYQRRTVATEL
ncbi:hypothetical protein NDU88_002341 [Pleurodeles waltl]|uniref:Uncharacterized protein n=1 Tax=Pleurodeles waltl TaxID=8319 RepID=A0AAV7W309_PLEWA|nr:hypothetical protein NDU88_002341 [Pleurodeles waltl]